MPCQWVLIRCVTGSGPRLERALVSCGRDTAIPPSTSTFPSGPVRTAILPPEPSSTLTFPRNLYTVTGEAAALSLMRSEEHTSELQSLRHLVCRLLLEKKKKNTTT